jgi:hypothetical protein
MAHLGLDQETRARVHVREAWVARHGLRLDPKVFPPRLVALYEENRPRDPAARLTGWLAPFAIGAGVGAGAVAAMDGGGPQPPSPTPTVAPERTLRLFNCDDQCRAAVNGEPAAEVGLGQDSGRVALMRWLKPGPNEIVFELLNSHGGICYGFEVRVGESIVFQQVCGLVAEVGCEGDRVFPAGVQKRFVYTLVN